MKVLSLTQLQFRFLTLIFIISASLVLGYRFFIEQPKHERTIAKFAERELATLRLTASNIVEDFSALSHDYAVWTSTYEYMETKDEEYIEENLVEDTFINLKLDGMFYFNEHHELVAGKGYSPLRKKHLNYTFTDLKSFPENRSLFPTPITSKGTPSQKGIIKTQHGPAIFSTKQIRRSDQTGENRGFLIFIRLIGQPMLNALSQYTMTKIEMLPFKADMDASNFETWEDVATITDIRKESNLIIYDLNKEPALIFNIQHKNNDIPPLIDTANFLFLVVFFFIIIIFQYFIAYVMIKPVQHFAYKLRVMDNADRLTKINKMYYIKELRNISKHFNALVDTVTDQKELLSKQVYIDGLTQITNRRGFEKHIKQQAELCVRNNVGFTVIMADIDYFKTYNDALGHQEGDNALILVAKTLLQHFKRANDMCARYGGEEFIMLYSDIGETALEDKLQIILDSFKTLNLPHPDSPTSNYVTVSLGACTVSAKDIQNHELPVRSIMRIADMALYQAKDKGRNQFVAYNYNNAQETS